MSVDSLAGHLSLLKFSGFVVADFTDVSGAQTPALAGRDSARRLSSSAALGRKDFDLGIEGGKMGKADDGIGGVDTDADDIDRRLVEVVHEMIIFMVAGKCEGIRAP